MNIPNQYESNLSNNVTEAEIAVEIPKIENIRIIIPSVVPNPPGSKGTALTSIASIVTIIGTMRFTLYPTAMNMK
jgi:hypothetical protein